MRIREFETRDDEACKALEVTASQFQGLGGLIKAAIVHHKSFDAKARQFGESLVLVADDEHGLVCGVVAVAIKHVYVHGAQRRCGYVFDLRVSSTHQGRGLGKALAQEAERRSEELGLELLYLSVNSSNDKARRLYTGMGWRPASRRILKMQPLLFPPHDVMAPLVELLEPSAALDLTARFYEARDLAPSASGFSKMFASDLYLATYTCSDGAGCAVPFPTQRKGAPPSLSTQVLLSACHAPTLPTQPTPEQEAPPHYLSGTDPRLLDFASSASCSPCVSWSRNRGPASTGAEPVAPRQLESNRMPCASWSRNGGPRQLEPSRRATGRLLPLRPPSLSLLYDAACCLSVLYR